MTAYGAVGLGAAALLCFYFLLSQRSPGRRAALGAGTALCSLGGIVLLLRLMLASDPPDLQLFFPCGVLMLFALWGWSALRGGGNHKSKKGGK